jgi:hypothetical protein
MFGDRRRHLGREPIVHADSDMKILEWPRLYFLSERSFRSNEIAVTHVGNGIPSAAKEFAEKPFTLLSRGFLRDSVSPW